MYRFLADILKAIFPRVFLKKAFLTYNKLKIRTWDKVFFKPLRLKKVEYEIFEAKNPFLELKIDIEVFPTAIQDGFKLWTNPSWTQDQYLLRYQQPAYIEPNVGWAVTMIYELIYPSLGFANAPHVHKPSWYETYINKRKIVRLKNVISLRDTGEENYFHFFNDVLAKIFFLQERNVELSNFVLIVSDKLWNKGYFQHYLKNTFIGSLNWHVQKEEWILFDSAVFCKPYTHTLKFYNRAVSLVNQRTFQTRERKVFLTRHSTTSRSLSNKDEIHNLVVSYGFEIIDSSELPFQDQVELFANTRYLIAIHGAGLVNMIFRQGEALDVMEIFPSEPYIPFHYIMIAKMYGYSYDLILGSKLTSNSTFCVNPKDLLVYLNRIFSQS
jgi:hypothetical protein